MLLVPAHNLGNSAGKHKDAAMCDAHHVDAESVQGAALGCSAERSPFHNGTWRRAVTAASARTATPIIPSSRADALPTRAVSSAKLPDLETAPCRAVAGSHLLPIVGAEDRSHLTVDLLVAFCPPRSCLGTHSTEIPTGLYLIVLRVAAAGRRGAIEAFKSGTYAGLATSTANFRRCRPHCHRTLNLPRTPNRIRRRCGTMADSPHRRQIFEFASPRFERHP